jgi:hypothetical protein
MNEDQNTPGVKSTETDQDASKVFLTEDSTLQSPEEFEKDKIEADDYYSVDDPKKEISTSIGDGEMRDEGIVGEGKLGSADLASEGQTDEQDSAEAQDREG